MPTDDFWADVPRTTARGANQPKPAVAPPLSKKKIADGVSQPTADASPEPIRKQRTQAWRPVVRGLILVLLLAAGAAGGIGFLIFEGITAQADALVREEQLVEIPKGMSSREIAQTLEERGVIFSQWSFLAYLKLTGSSVRAGVYALSPALTTKEIIELLATGDIASQRVTIPEGWRLEQIADLLDKAEIVARAEFIAASAYDPVRYTLPPGFALAAGDSLEGLLYPDTYEFAYGTTAKEIVATMLDNFTKKIAGLAVTYEQIILASIVEREAKLDEDRAKIAGVYTNRQKANLRLEADPTVQYGRDNLAVTNHPVGATGFSWWSPITIADYQAVKSPYNTYLIAGLPPAPICNPGLASLAAAVQPADHANYFFFSRPDGRTVYSQTRAEHDQQKQAQGE